MRYARKDKRKSKSNCSRTMMGLVRLLFFAVLFCLISQSTWCIPQLFRKRPFDATPIYLYGYINNEHYKHWMPGAQFGATEGQKIGPTGDPVKLICIPGSVIKINRASYGTPRQIESNDWINGACSHGNSKAVVQKLCEGLESCELKPEVDLFVTEDIPDPCPGLDHKLAVDYECRNKNRPAPLYDREKKIYRTGVTPHYLTLPEYTATCSPKKLIQIPEHVSKEIYSINDAKQLCNKIKSCAFFVWNFKSREGSFCQGHQWQTSEKNEDSLLAVKPSEFFIPGFAVYLNYMGICPTDSIILKKDSLYNLKEAAGLCLEHNGCSSVTLSTTHGLRSLPGYENYLWSCKGTPTFIPMDGMVFAARVEPGQGPLPPDQGPFALSSALAEPSNIDIYEFPQGYPTESEVSKRKAFGPPRGSELAGQFFH